MGENWEQWIPKDCETPKPEKEPESDYEQFPRVFSGAERI
jgi:hypothetical protein